MGAKRGKELGYQMQIYGKRNRQVYSCGGLVWPVGLNHTKPIGPRSFCISFLTPFLFGFFIMSSFSFSIP